MSASRAVAEVDRISDSTSLTCDTVHVAIHVMNHRSRHFLHLAVAALDAGQVVLHDLLAALAEVLAQRLLDAGVDLRRRSCRSLRRRA